VGGGFLYINNNPTKTGVGASWGRLLLSDSSNFVCSGPNYFVLVSKPRQAWGAAGALCSSQTGLALQLIRPLAVLQGCHHDLISHFNPPSFEHSLLVRPMFNESQHESYRSNQCQAQLRKVFAQPSTTDYLTCGKCIALSVPFTRPGGMNWTAGPFDELDVRVYTKVEVKTSPVAGLRYVYLESFRSI
jgi:hypothetical protein